MSFVDFLNAHFWPLWSMAVFALVFALAALDRFVCMFVSGRRR